ncbi:hypothetical protein SO694_00025040 [Aureococcus anophagefferens]|uniref:Leucine-rich repeat and WD repeat-containing protein 1 n=2 Tax=Aureococcus anophagefferens TaxID=44056 RepID=A0ABR1FVG0_AURAN
MMAQQLAIALTSDSCQLSVLSLRNCQVSDGVVASVVGSGGAPNLGLDDGVVDALTACPFLAELDQRARARAPRLPSEPRGARPSGAAGARPGRRSRDRRAPIRLEALRLGATGAESRNAALSVAGVSRLVRRYKSLLELDLTWCAVEPRALRELAKARSLASLDLSGTLDAACDGATRLRYAGDLGSLLNHGHALTSLSLRHCPLGVDGAQAVATALKNNRTLLDLDLADAGLGDDAIARLSEGLARNKTLGGLGLDGNRFETCASLARSGSLARLSLRRVPRFSAASARALGAALKGNGALRTLRLSAFATLHVQDLRGDVGVRAEQRLALCDKQLSSQDYAVVSRLLEANKKLTALDVSGNDTGASWADDVRSLFDDAAVVRTLQTVKVHAHTLDVKKICGGEHVEYARAGLARIDAFAVAALLRHNTHIRVVDLCHNGVQSDAIVDLCDALRGKTSLSSLLVAGNNFAPRRHAPLFARSGDDGAAAPLDASSPLCAVTCLMVVDSWAILKEDTTFAVKSALKGAHTFEDKQMQLLCGVLCTHDRLRSLALKGAELTEAGVRDLVVALGRNRTLETLDLRESLAPPASSEAHAEKSFPDLDDGDRVALKWRSLDRTWYALALDLGAALEGHERMDACHIFPLWTVRKEELGGRSSALAKALAADRPPILVKYLKSNSHVRLGARPLEHAGTDTIDEPPLLPLEVAVASRLLRANRSLVALDVRGLGPNADVWLDGGGEKRAGANDVLFDVVESHAAKLETFSLVSGEAWRAAKLHTVISAPKLRYLELRHCGLTAQVAHMLFTSLKVLETSGKAAPLEVVSLDENDLDDSVLASTKPPAIGDIVDVDIVPEELDALRAALKLDVEARVDAKAPPKLAVDVALGESQSAAAFEDAVLDALCGPAAVHGLPPNVRVWVEDDVMTAVASDLGFENLRDAEDDPASGPAKHARDGGLKRQESRKWQGAALPTTPQPDDRVAPCVCVAGLLLTYDRGDAGDRAVLVAQGPKDEADGFERAKGLGSAKAEAWTVPLRRGLALADPADVLRWASARLRATHFDCRVVERVFGDEDHGFQLVVVATPPHDDPERDGWVRACGTAIDGALSDAPWAGGAAAGGEHVDRRRFSVAFASGEAVGREARWTLDLAPCHLPATELVGFAAHEFSEGHGGEVTSVAVSGDGNWVATGSCDKTARVWDADSGACLATLTGHGSFVRGVAFSPDGTRVATASQDHTAKVWDAATGSLLRTLEGHELSVNAVAFSPDGHRLATASRDKTALVWDLRDDAAPPVVLEGHDSCVNGCAFAPDGSRVATASNDKRCIVWDAATGEELESLEGHENWVEGCAFSPDGARVATASQDHHARVWEGGVCVMTLAGHGKRVNGVAFAGDGATLVTASDDETAKRWDLATGACLETMHHRSEVNACAFGRGGTLVATACNDRTAKLWDAATAARTRTLNGCVRTAVAEDACFCVGDVVDWDEGRLEGRVAGRRSGGAYRVARGDGEVDVAGAALRLVRARPISCERVAGRLEEVLGDAYAWRVARVDGDGAAAVAALPVAVARPSRRGTVVGARAGKLHGKPKFDVSYDDGSFEAAVPAARVRLEDDAAEGSPRPGPFVAPRAAGKAMAAIGAWLGDCATVRALSLRDVNLWTVRGPLCEGLARARRLETLDIAGNPCCDERVAGPGSAALQAPALAGAVADSALAHLRLGARLIDTRSLLRDASIDLTSDATCFAPLERAGARDKGANFPTCAVVAALASRNDALERLTARGLFRDDGDTFAAFLGHLRPARRLRHLDLSGNGLGVAGATRLREWLFARRLLAGSRALESLVLRDDDLVPRAVEQVLLGGPRGKPPRSPRLDAFSLPEPHHRSPREASLRGSLREASPAAPGSHHGPLAPPPTDAPRKATADWRRRVAQHAANAERCLGAVLQAPARHGPAVAWLRGLVEAAGFPADLDDGAVLDAARGWLAEERRAAARGRAARPRRRRGRRRPGGPPVSARGSAPGPPLPRGLGRRVARGRVRRRDAGAGLRARRAAAPRRGARAWYWREADASKARARARDTFLALKTRRVDLLLMEELDTTLLTKKAVARVAEAAPDAAALPGDVEATGLPRLELDPDEIVEVEEALGAETGARAILACRDATKQDARVAALSDATARLELARARRDAMRAAGAESGGDAVFVRLDASGALEEAQLVSSLGETWHVRRFGDTVSSSSDAIKGWVKARLGGDSYAVFMEASDDDVYYGTREDGAKELEGVFDRADIFAAFDEPPRVADEAAARRVRGGLGVGARRRESGGGELEPAAEETREEDWRVDALDGVLEACRGAFRSALAASPEALVVDYWRADGRDASPSDRIAKVAAVLQRQLLLESQPSLDRGPVLELESVARVEPDPRVARGFARALSRCRNRHRPDAAKTEETRRTPQQDAVLRTLEARKTGLAGASLAEGWDDGVTVFHGGEPSKLRAVMDDGFRDARSRPYEASLPPGRLKLSLRRCAVVGDGAARLEDVAVSLTSSMNAGTDDAAPEDAGGRDDDDVADAATVLQGMGLVPKRPFAKLAATISLPVASGALRVDLTVKPTHCFKAHGSDRLHFKETTITVPVYSCAPDGLQVNPVDGAAILPFCVDVPLELASGEEVDDVDQGEGQGATTPASVSPRDGAGHVAGLRSSFHGLAETKAADLHVRLEGVATMHYDIPPADYEKSARGGRRTWGKHYGRGHYTSTEPAYATLYSAAFGGGHADNVLVDVAHHANATGLANPKMVSPRAPPSKVEVLRDSLSVSFWMKRSSALDLGSPACVLSTNLRPATANTGEATFAETIDADDVCGGVVVYVDGLGRVKAQVAGVVVGGRDADEEVKTTFRVDGDRRTNEDEWWHVAVVFDGDDARCKIYMNGDLDGSNSPHLAVHALGADAGATHRVGHAELRCAIKAADVCVGGWRPDGESRDGAFRGELRRVRLHAGALDAVAVGHCAEFKSSTRLQSSGLDDAPLDFGHDAVYALVRPVSEVTLKGKPGLRKGYSRHFLVNKPVVATSTTMHTHFEPVTEPDVFHTWVSAHDATRGRPLRPADELVLPRAAAFLPTYILRVRPRNQQDSVDEGRQAAIVDEEHADVVDDGDDGQGAGHGDHPALGAVRELTVAQSSAENVLRRLASRPQAAWTGRSRPGSASRRSLVDRRHDNHADAAHRLAAFLEAGAADVDAATRDFARARGGRRGRRRGARARARRRRRARDLRLLGLGGLCDGGGNTLVHIVAGTCGALRDAWGGASPRRSEPVSVAMASARRARERGRALRHRRPRRGGGWVWPRATSRRRSSASTRR